MEQMITESFVVEKIKEFLIKKRKWELAWGKSERI